MQEKINALLFDFSRANMEKNEVTKESIISGENILNDIIQSEKSEFSNSPFVKLIEIECVGPYNQVKDEQMSNTLSIDKNNLCFYQIYTHSFKNSRSFTKEHSLDTANSEKIIILANKKMFEEANNIFEIRYKIKEEWSSWQAIAGKFIVALEYRFGPGGIAEVYNSMGAQTIENFKQNFQIRYSGSIVSELIKPNTLHRIINDPINSDIRKIIDPKSFQILFDSQIIQQSSNDNCYEIWADFVKRYR